MTESDASPPLQRDQADVVHSNSACASASGKEREREASADTSIRNLQMQETQADMSHRSNANVHSHSRSASASSNFLYQTPMSGSPSSFRSITHHNDDTLDDELLVAQTAAFGLGSGPESGRAYNVGHDRNDSEPATKRRRGIAGTLVSTAFHAALYTGAAAVTAYSLWSSWGQRPDTEIQTYRPQQGPEPDMGLVVSPNKDVTEHHQRPCQEEPPPPYEDEDEVSWAGLDSSSPLSSTLSHRDAACPLRTRRKVNFRRPEASRQSTAKNVLVRKSLKLDEGSGITNLISSSSNKASELHEGSEEESSTDEDDEVMRRFEDRMNALISEGQAALNSTPVLQQTDLVDLDDPPSLIGLTDSGPAARLFIDTTDIFHSSSPPGSPITRHKPAESMLPTPSVLPEPSKRTRLSTLSSTPSMHRSRSLLSLKYSAAELPNPPLLLQSSATDNYRSHKARSSPSKLPRASLSGNTTMQRSPKRISDHTSTSPHSRIPRSTSTIPAHTTTA